MSFTNYMKASSSPTYSNYSTLGTQSNMGCSDPSRETPLYDIYTLKELYETNFLPRAKEDFQIVKRYSSFPLESEITNKSSNIHTSNSEVYYDINKSPNRCVYNSCGETKIPVYISNKLKK